MRACAEDGGSLGEGEMGMGREGKEREGKKKKRERKRWRATVAGTYCTIEPKNGSVGNSE